MSIFFLLFFFFWKPNNTCHYIMLSWRDITQAASVWVVYSHYEEKARLILLNVHQKRSTDCSHVQTTVLMSEAEKPYGGNGKRAAVWACISLTQVIEGTSQAPGAEEATGPSELLSQPTDNHACYSGAFLASDANRHGSPPTRLTFPTSTCLTPASCSPLTHVPHPRPISLALVSVLLLFCVRLSFKTVSSVPLLSC